MSEPGNFFDSLKTCWHWRGDEYDPPVAMSRGRSGEVVSLLTSQRQMAVSVNRYRRASGALLAEGNVGLIEVDGRPVLVRRERSTGGAEYLAEL